MQTLTFDVRAARIQLGLLSPGQGEKSFAKQTGEGVLDPANFPHPA